VTKIFPWANTAVSLLAVGVGGILVLWSLVCLLGGPDGKIGEPESFVYAFLFGVAGFTEILYSWKWFKWSLHEIDVNTRKGPPRALDTAADAAMELRTGEKIGWTFGFSGAFLWIVILSLVFLLHNKLAQGLSGLLLVVLAACSIMFLAPWRSPSTPYWKLMVPIYVLFFVTLLWAVWAYGGPSDLGLTWGHIFLVLPLLLPFLTMGKKTWNDFGGRADRKGLP